MSECHIVQVRSDLEGKYNTIIPNASMTWNSAFVTHTVSEGAFFNLSKIHKKIHNTRREHEIGKKCSSIKMNYTPPPRILFLFSSKNVGNSIKRKENMK